MLKLKLSFLSFLLFVNITYVPFVPFSPSPKGGSNSPCLQLVLELRLEVPLCVVDEEVPGEEVVPEPGGEDDLPPSELLRDDHLDVVARLEHVQQGYLVAWSMEWKGCKRRAFLIKVHCTTIMWIYCEIVFFAIII